MTSALERIQQDCIGSGPFGVIVDKTSDISRHGQVSICLSFIADGVKKEAFVGFYETKTTDGKTLYNLITKAISDLNLDLINIVGECFDGAANMSGKEKGVAARMKDCSPHAIYVHCYGHLLNLVLQDTMTEVKALRNALGTIQSLDNLLEASSKRHAMFGDIEVERDHLMLTLKSQSVTRWSCRWEAVKAVTEQIERIVKALIKLANDKDAKTYSDSRALLNAICDFEFVLGLCILKVILSNTSAMSTYLQGKKVLAELETRFQGNNQDVLCALGAVVLSEKPSESDYELVSNFYGLDKDLIEVEQRLFNQFKQIKAIEVVLTSIATHLSVPGLSNSDHLDNKKSKAKRGRPKCERKALDI
ncbi:zinc finger MYM-type protein 1-like [Dendronephthya gigantea]|uniref:zinc finger MYM-type protein 1-like n=1 Tax=Dendronephthya gigantea TaxID=151771 RepID=UPI00106D070F|nr:zinc finger MYM-type protein 1-like [Dendronephthya gigantea]